MSLIDKLDVENELLDLIQENNFVGWVYSIDYEKALIVTNDEWKQNVKGIPHNSFLVATSFNPNNFMETEDIDKQVILFRVTGSCKLPQDDDMIKTRIDGFQKQKEKFAEEEYDFFTKNQMQFSGLECRVLGTFYIKNDDLVLGSDIETFYALLKLNVYMPTGKALEKIVNYVDPIRKRNSKAEFKALGIEGDIEAFKVGTVRYTSTDRLHRADDNDLVPFRIQPSDFLARRTAVLGMTRTGKSNMIKQTISVVKDISIKCGLPIGQLIYDINGEYANTNEQDKGAIADIYTDECIRYRMVKTEGFRPLLTNFYEQIEEGFQIICDVLDLPAMSNDLKAFKNISLYKPEGNDINLNNRYNLKLAIYKALLKKAKFTPPKDYKIKFTVSESILAKINTDINPNKSITLDDAITFFELVRSVNLANPIKNTSNNEWLDSECVAIDDKDRRKYEAMLSNKPLYESIIQTLKANISDKVYREPKDFVDLLSTILSVDKKLIEKIADGLSVMDKTAEIQRDKKGNIIYDKETYDREIVKYDESIEDYMAREVLPYVPDAQWFWEENLSAKKPIIKIGAEIPFTRYFYKYQQPENSEELKKKFLELEQCVSERIKKLFSD